MRTGLYPGLRLTVVRLLPEYKRKITGFGANGKRFNVFFQDNLYFCRKIKQLFLQVFRMNPYACGRMRATVQEIPANINK